MRPQAGGIFDMSGAGRTRRHPRAGALPGTLGCLIAGLSTPAPHQTLSKLVPSSDAESTALRRSPFVKIRSIRGLNFPVCLLRSRSCRPSGCLRQATQPAPAGMCSSLPPSLPLMSPYRLPAAGSVGSHPPGISHPSGYLCSLPRNRPVTWFPEVSIVKNSDISFCA